MEPEDRDVRPDEERDEPRTEAPPTDDPPVDDRVDDAPAAGVVDPERTDPPEPSEPA